MTRFIVQFLKFDNIPDQKLKRSALKKSIKERESQTLSTEINKERRTKNAFVKK